MKTINTREVMKDIKVLDKAGVASERMRDAYVRTKEAPISTAESAKQTPFADMEGSQQPIQSRQTQNQEDGSPNEYAVNSVERSGERTGSEVRERGYQHLRREIHSHRNKSSGVDTAIHSEISEAGSSTLRDMEVQAQKKILQKERFTPKAKSQITSINPSTVKEETAVQTRILSKRNAAGKRTSSAVPRQGKIKTSANAKLTAPKGAVNSIKAGNRYMPTANKQQTAARKMAVRGFQKRRMATKTTTQTLGYLPRAIAAVARTTLAAAKGLVALCSTGGGLVVLLLVVIILFGGAVASMFNNQTGNAAVSEEVLAYTPLIQKYADEHGIPEYFLLIQAVMMQESGGRGLDPMQSAEGPYNTRFPKVPNGITDPEYSINVGIQELASCLKQAKVTSPMDVDLISLALQGYNYGNGYITWALKNHGGYSAANAKAFSDMMKARLGWSVYGDPDYVPHVLRYYPMTSLIGGGIGTGVFLWPHDTYNITSNFGYRSKFGDFHTGVDVGAAKGTPIYAADGGTITKVRYLTTSYGYHIIIDHGNGYTTLYAHMSAIYVSEGQAVTRGQTVGAVGSTGRSTGNHLHFEIRQNGNAVNPLTFFSL